MPIGLQTFLDSGVVQIDSEKFTYHYKQKGTAIGTIQSGAFGGAYWLATVDITGCTNPIMFVEMGRIVTNTLNLGSGTWRFTLISSENEFIPYIVFDIGLSSATNLGIKLYNSSNQITFDSNIHPLIVTASGYENTHHGTGATNLPFSGTANRKYYTNGGGTLKVERPGIEIFPNEWQSDNYIAIMQEVSDYTFNFVYHLLESSTILSVGAPSPTVLAPNIPIPWMVADLTNLVDHIDINNTNISYSLQTANPVAVTFRVLANGFIERTNNSGTVKIAEWLTPLTSGNTSNYEIQATISTGTFSGSAFNTWLPLNSDRSWTNTQSATGTKNGTIVVQIRETSTTRILTTAIITMNATRTSPPL